MRRKRTNRDLVEDALLEWGLYESMQPPGIDYPEMSVEGRMMDGGTCEALSRGIYPEYSVDREQVRLKMFISSLDDRHRAILTAKYLHRMKDMEICERARMRPGDYQAELKVVLSIIGGWMGLGAIF